MFYQDVLKKIEGLQVFGIKLGLERIKEILKKLENPQDKINFVHVAGTNGKGSVCYMLASILEQAEYKVGLFVSPFVTDFRESICINKAKISKKDLAKIYNLVEQSKVDAFTKFEAITAIAFKWFCDNKCDVVILETGLGGKFDSTNVIKSPLVSIITSISYDHTNILGNTLESIAEEKCGIIKENCDTVVYPQQNEKVLKIIKKCCKNKKSVLTIPNILDFNVIRENISGTYLEYNKEKLFLPLVGNHQVKNLSTVLLALKGLSKAGVFVTKEQVSLGLVKTFVPARFEVVKQKPLVILDGAHNEASVFALFESLNKYTKNKRRFALISFLKSKDYDSCLKIMCKNLDGFFVTKSKNDLALDPKRLASSIEEFGGEVLFVDDDSSVSTEKALSFCKEDELLLVSGSFYLIREVRRSFLI